MKTQRKQYLVKLNGEIEGEDFISLLEENGYSNPSKISYKDMQIKVLVVDEDKFFPTNVTCLSAAATVGIKTITVDEFLEISNLNNNNYTI